MIYQVTALKYFHDGNLSGLSVPYKVNYTTLESAVDCTKFLLSHTEIPALDLQGKSVTYHCVEINAVDEKAIGENSP